MKAKGTEPLTPGMGAKSKAERITNGTPALNSQGRYLPAFDVLLSTYVPTIGSQKTLMIRTKRNINPAVAVLMVLTVSM